MRTDTTGTVDDRLALLTQELADLRVDVGRQSVQFNDIVQLLQNLMTKSPVQQDTRISHLAPKHFVAQPQLDASAVRGVIRQRESRKKYFPAHLFADPAWDMLLDLAAAKAEKKRVSVTSLCLASGVPMTTALRWITTLSEEKLIERIEDPTDGRRVFIELTEQAYQAMIRYFGSAENSVGLLG